ncbi:glycosyltransferase family 4 protein [Photobacterium leiognathi]|uniref:glycosyltransferase family 4 protein n=1 Tax=Photobacterium leiognathi TaxID=553611 RepID=UPI0029813C2C|nr:glycosyltransferase [Photobacterium leiognathi]
MKILFVVDSPNWAFDNIAKKIRSSINKDVDVKIVYTCDYATYNDFIAYLNSNTNDVDIIHFFWRDYLMETLDFAIQNKSDIINVFVNKKITTHIPDHLYLDNHYELEKRYSILNFVDGYFTTSSKIYKEYVDNRFIQSPLSVIYDNPEIKILPNPKNNPEVVKIVWIGNSKWGEHLNYVDYKGLNNIVKPAISKIRKKHKNILYKEYDRAKLHTDHNIILRSLAESDVLLISSVAEGTPLPLIEAMANECAIVTTDVGIASEVLPKIQRDFITERSDDAFYHAIDKLISDKDLLSEIKKENKKQYCSIFGSGSDIGQQWLNFFNTVNNKNRNELKEKYCGELPVEKIQDKYIKKTLSASLEIAKKCGIAERIKNNAKLSNVYYNLLGKSINNRQDYSLFESSYEDSIRGKEVVALYSGYWLGVANSTISFFGELSIPYPLFSTEYPQITEHCYLDKMVELLTSSKELTSIILSGGTLLQQTLAKRVKEIKPELQIYFLWHGSPAQWCDLSQYNLFNEWRNLYKNSFIDGFITCKPELDNTLTSMGILSYSIINFMPDFNYKNVLHSPKIDDYRIGFFAALFSWYKNPFPQLTALSGVSGCHLTTNLQLSDEQLSLLSCDDVTTVPGHMSNKMFVEMLSRLHVVLYVTNTECSPMIALESISVGTPCIVGPAGNIYKGNKRLEELLVVTEVDNPYAISKQLDIVRDNYNEIKMLISEFKIAYNPKVLDIKNELLKELSNV